LRKRTNIELTIPGKDNKTDADDVIRQNWQSIYTEKEGKREKEVTNGKKANRV